MTTIAPPVRTNGQRMDALEKANEVRSARAKLKLDLKARKVTPGRVLLEPERPYQGMRVNELLLAVPKYGAVKVGRMMSFNDISPSKTIGGLSPRQRDVLIRLVG